MKPEIQLNSSGGIDNRLIQIEGKPLHYRLKTEFNYRTGFKDESTKECYFIDPAGGPFITIGSEIEGHVVKAILIDGTVVFES